MSKTERIFILGAARSGTTFLASLMGDTRFGAPFETHFIVKYFHRLDSYGDLNKFCNFECLLSDILNERAVMQWNLELDAESFYSEFDGCITYAKIIDKLCLLSNQDVNRFCWGDKTPSYLADIDVLYELFPEAKFIYIVRDGRDVAMSLLKKNWGPNNVFSCAEYWNELNKDREQIDMLYEKGQLIELSYENLLEDTELYIRKVYAFIDEDCKEEVITRLSQTTNKGNYFKWQSAMTPRQKKVFSAVAGDTLVMYGYEVENSKRLSDMEKLFYRLHNKAIWLVYMFHANVVDGFKIKYMGKEPFAEKN